MEKSNLYHCLKEHDYNMLYVLLILNHSECSKINLNFFPREHASEPQEDHPLEALPTECQNPTLTSTQLTQTF